MKKKVRQELIKVRKSFLKEDVFEKSKEIKGNLFDLTEFKEASNILFYVSYDNEVNTHDMIKESMKKKKNVIVPISDKINRCLILSELKNWDDLEQGSYGIFEPRKEKIKEAPIEKIELIIVPGVGFDEKGNRIGHGKGFYDNLLRNSTNIPHIGLAFESQTLKEIPIQSHDLPVHKIVTEKRVIDCKNN